MGFINENITIDFNVPKDIKKIMEICDKLSNEENYAYDNYADFLIDNLCKDAYVKKHLTKHQWETIERRYHYA